MVNLSELFVNKVRWPFETIFNSALPLELWPNWTPVPLLLSPAVTLTYALEVLAASGQTCKSCCGFVLPIAMLPEVSIRIFSPLFTFNTKGWLLAVPVAPTKSWLYK